MRDDNKICVCVALLRLNQLDQPNSPILYLHSSARIQFDDLLVWRCACFVDDVLVVGYDQVDVDVDVDYVNIDV